MLIQIHILQNYAPSNLNRDDTGSPKEAIFGGHRRGRISSQCIKRSIRHSETFKMAFEKDGMLANRTLLLPTQIRPLLAELGADEAAQQLITKRLTELGGGKADEGKTKLLIFLTNAEMEIVAQQLWALYEEQGAKKFEKMKIGDIEKGMAHATPRSIDVAMFGRMTTSAAFDDIHAAVQVAHALSTNALAQEFDYFTAVDDLSGESGAGMIGDTEFNSSTYYKYFNIHWEKLVENLGGDATIAKDAVVAFIEAAAFAQPSGKQNSFAANNLPDFVMVELSERNVPISYTNAFLKPINYTHGQSLMENSAAELSQYATKIGTAYSINRNRAVLSLVSDIPLPDSTTTDSLSALQTWVKEQIDE